MTKKILIVEDESVIAFDLELILTKAGYQVCGIADTVEDALEVIEKKMPDMVLLDIFLIGPQNGIDLARILTVKNIAFVYLSANFQESILEKAKLTQPYGFLVKPFREQELLVTLDVAFYRHCNSLESRLRQERSLENRLEKIAKEQAAPEQKILSLARHLQAHVPFDYFITTIKNDDKSGSGNLAFLRIGFDEYQSIGINELLTISKTSADEYKKMGSAALVNTKAEVLGPKQFDKVLRTDPLKQLIAGTFDLKSYLGIPLLLPTGEIVYFSFYSKKTDTYSTEHLDLLNRLQRPMMMVLESISSSRQVNIPGSENENAIKNNSNKPKPTIFEGIIAKSHEMLRVLDNIALVAPLDTSVLILGESGTGKEAIARNIHRLSARSENALVTVNCASLPPTLIESELFGHEKGAFTGATEKRIGKFEIADKGTIFLDEIGEMPAELQVKLLRVLQEHEIERIGG